jgi:lysophospholipase L1-like esterase
MKKCLAALLVSLTTISGIHAENSLFDWTKEGLPASTSPAVQPKRMGDWNFRAFRRGLTQKCNVLFIGDSITWGLITKSRQGTRKDQTPQGYDIWKTSFLPLNASGAGIGGIKTTHVLGSLLDISDSEKLSPKVIVILIGINNVNDPKFTVDDTVTGIDYILKLLRKKAPDAKILTLGLFPCWKKGRSWEKVRQINEKIAAFADDKQIYFLDFGEKFKTADGTDVDRDLLWDGIHPSRKGYELYAETLVPHLKKLLE